MKLKNLRINVKRQRHTGFAIAIAWPETYIKQPGSWYDSLANLLGISTNHYYKVGHAAVVLIDSETNKCHYFDFGRYHAPFQHGRVRSEITDHSLKINTLAQISDDGQRIENLNQILTELQLNHECHGEGALHASYCQIDFELAIKKALQLQEKSPIPYGPFRYNGSNCSRFVNTTILAGNPNGKYKFKLKYLVVLTPTPLNNVNSLQNKVIIPKLLKTKAFCPVHIADKQKLKLTLEQPFKNEKIPENAQWLSGEGSGSWFSICQDLENYRISRYSPEGELECCGVFKVSNFNYFNINLPFQIDHLSHCQSVRVKQFDKIIIFKRFDHKPEIQLISTITCPVCGHRKEEEMPTDACQYFYECENCKSLLKPKQGDSCVYCSYGSEKCPSIQEINKCC